MGGGGTGGGGIGGGGGSPGGGTPGGGGGSGGGGGGRPGETTAGNNLSVPAIFIGSAPVLRGDPGQYLFSTPATPTVEVPDDYVYFAQGVEGNEWQADSIVTQEPVVVDYVNIGDALESAPIKQGGNVRLELTLFEEVADVTDVAGQQLTGFEMQLLGGAKGKGSPSKTGPTESQGARYPTTSEWEGDPFEGDAASAPVGVTYETPFASVYAADSTATTESETGDSYMRLAIQKVTGLNPRYATDQSALEGANDDVDLLTGAFGWDGTKWVDADTSDGITVGDNLANVNFGPELTISGTYNVGASGKPWKFTTEGVYLITFALDKDAPISFDANTLVRNDDPALSGFQPTELSEGRLTQVVSDGFLSFGGPDTHNGLLAMLVGVPSSVGGTGEVAVSGLV